jgi:hypothetical protein
MSDSMGNTENQFPGPAGGPPLMLVATQPVSTEAMAKAKAQIAAGGGGLIVLPEWCRVFQLIGGLWVELGGDRGDGLPDLATITDVGRW